VVEEAVRRSRDADPVADPSTEETIAMEAVSPGPHGSEDTTTRPDACDAPGGKEADIVRDLKSELIHSTSEAADLRVRLELTERAESSLREDLERVRDQRQRHQEEAERLRGELEAERSKGFWRRLFGE